MSNTQLETQNVSQEEEQEEEQKITVKSMDVLICLHENRMTDLINSLPTPPSMTSDVKRGLSTLEIEPYDIVILTFMNIRNNRIRFAFYITDYTSDGKDYDKEETQFRNDFHFLPQDILDNKNTNFLRVTILREGIYTDHLSIDAPLVDDKSSNEVYALNSSILLALSYYPAGFLDKQPKFVDKQSEVVDEQSEVVDEQPEFVDKQPEFVDKQPNNDLQKTIDHILKKKPINFERIYISDLQRCGETVERYLHRTHSKFSKNFVILPGAHEIDYTEGNCDENPLFSRNNRFRVRNSANITKCLPSKRRDTNGYLFGKYRPLQECLREKIIPKIGLFIIKCIHMDEA